MFAVSILISTYDNIFNRLPLSIMTSFGSRLADDPTTTDHLSYSQEPVLPVQFEDETFSSRVSDAINHFSLPFDTQRTPRIPRTGPRATFWKEGASLSRRIGGRPAATGPRPGNIQIKSSLPMFLSMSATMNVQSCQQLSIRWLERRSRPCFDPVSFVIQFQDLS